MKWLKSGVDCGSQDSHSKYKVEQENDGLIHRLIVNDVQYQDEGVYTFKVTDTNVESPKVVIQGQWPGQIPLEFQG